MKDNGRGTNRPGACGNVFRAKDKKNNVSSFFIAFDDFCLQSDYYCKRIIFWFEKSRYRNNVLSSEKITNIDCKMLVMKDGKDLIEEFMAAFSERDFMQMQQIYSDDIQYYDPLFGLSSGSEVLRMWKVRYGACESFSMHYSRCRDLGDGYFTSAYEVSWKSATYKKNVTQKIIAHMKVENGVITEHSDAFSVHDWCAQCFGFFGKLLGWNRFYQNAVKNKISRMMLG